MRPYLAIVRIVITSILQYRAATVVKILTHIFWGMIHVAVIAAFYASTTTPQPISLHQAISLTWLGQVLLQLLPWMIDPELEAQIQNGNVAYELARPLHLYWTWFFRAAASRIIPALLHAVPMMFIAGAFLNLDLPPTFFSGCAFIMSLALAAFLSATMATCITITLFWTISGEGIKKLLPHTALFLSGIVIPLPLFPAWSQPFLNLQPFRGIIDIPSRLYIGLIPESEAFLYLGFQLAWAVGFIILGKILMRLAMKRFVVQGG